MMDSWKSMYVTFDDLMQHVKRVAERSGYSVKEGHPEDLVSNLVPLMEAWSDGFGVGYQQGVIAGRDIQKSIDENAVSYEQIRDRITEACDKYDSEN